MTLARIFCRGLFQNTGCLRSTSWMKTVKIALYWRDVGTLDAYYEANMDLTSVSPIFNLYDKELAAAHVAAAVSAGKIRVCRS